MKTMKNSKIERVLGIYTKLLHGCPITKKAEAQNYGVDDRSIQRDIDDIRNFLELDSENSGVLNSVIYSRKNKSYHLEQASDSGLSNSEILALCKILLDSRAFCKSEMEGLINKLIACCVPKNNRNLVNDLIRNELFHYVEPHHKAKFNDIMWDIGQAIHSCRYIEIEYARIKDHALIKRKLKPVAIMFSEYYFYLTAFIDDEAIRKDFEITDDTFPTIYRMDRIKKLNVLNENFHIPYRNRFEEGEFRKRIQFMYGGRLQKVKFKYKGPDISAVLDRLPTAQIINEKDGVFTITAEVFGKGIDMWLRSQGNMVELIPALQN